MEWSSVINNPFLQNLPFKIELDKWGKILMSPASNIRGSLQFEVGTKIREGKNGNGKVIMECSIETSQGVKVADVAWASDAFIAEHGFQTPYPVAPEICIEIVSPSNTKGEMDEKVELYLAKGAHEVWIVDESGKTRFCSHQGELDTSKEIPAY